MFAGEIRPVRELRSLDFSRALIINSIRELANTLPSRSARERNFSLALNKKRTFPRARGTGTKAAEKTIPAEM